MTGKHDRLLMRAVHGELNRWGKWIEARLDWQGYPSVCVLENFRNGDRSGEPGHKVLMLDMPTEVWSTHHRVLSLSEALREAVTAFYVFTTKEDGTTWSFPEKCLKLGVSRETFWERLSRARRRIAGLDGNVKPQVVLPLKWVSVSEGRR